MKLLVFGTIGYDNQHNGRIELVFDQKYHVREHLGKLAFPSKLLARLYLFNNK